MQPSQSSRRLPLAAIIAVVIGAGGALALAGTNPSRSEYEAHAGRQLVTLATQELCENSGLPMVLRLWIRDCPRLVASQQPTLAALAGRFTTRRNLLVASIYTTRVGGQELLPGLTLPGVEVVTLAGAGRFLTLHTQTSDGGAE